MFNKNKEKKEKGFTLLELMIVIAIFAILTAITVFNYRDFDSNILMTNVAHEVAFSIREAQSYSLSVRSFDEGGTQSFDGGYGVEFFTNPGGGIPVEEKRKSFLFFVDKEDDDTDLGYGVCTSPYCEVTGCGGNECLNVISLTQNIEIEMLCYSDVSTKMQIETSPLGCGVYLNPTNKLSISFQRPDPDAIIMVDDSRYGAAAIILKSPSGSRRAVHVLSNGQISVEFLHN